MGAKHSPHQATMSAQGRLTVPVEARRQLQLEGETQFEIEVIEGKLVLSPTVPHEDAWAYTPEHLALVERAREDGREGRVYRLSRSELEQLIGEGDEQN
jgi:bifunctional DNA-binding transcriptional regulator/antitoxin component of YhaV-PrlF toxin-antitoxin module